MILRRMAESHILMKTHYWSCPFVQVNLFFKRNWQGRGAFFKDGSAVRRQSRFTFLCPFLATLGPRYTHKVGIHT